ncbi:FtsX-like permease family protein [Paenibacillus glufosinatiresistens]|uniref:FtsX-like permease family protein n=1 Tax=Paenibacillus glufosinatiresistens TaxID=3070657 RepID=UPI00286E3F63|nr:FtsX-like permease family protein [Paenibacillus sp. YX.27]
MIAIRSAIRSLWRSRFRTGFTVLALVIGSASLFCMLLVSELAPRSIESSARLMLGGDIRVESYLEPLQLGEASRRVRQTDRGASIAASYVGQSMIRSEKRTTSIILKGIDPGRYPLYGAERYPGIRSLKANEILLTDEAAGRLRVKAGDRVSLPSSSDGNLHVYQVKGLVRQVQESYGDADILGTAYISREQAVRLLNAPAGSVNELAVKWSPAASAAGKGASLERQFPNASLTDTGAQAEREKSRVRMVLLLLQLFSLLTLAISAMAISNTMKQALGSRMREIAVMKATGMPLRSIEGLFLAEGLLIGLAGTAGGLAAAVPASLWLTGKLGSLLNVPLSWEFSRKAAAMTAAAGMLSAWTSVRIPLRAMRPLSPLPLLREGAEFPLPPSGMGIRRKGAIGAALSLAAAFYLQPTLLPGSAGLPDIRLVGIGAAIGCLLALAAFMARGGAALFSGLLRGIGAARRRVPSRWYVPFHHLSADRRRYGWLLVVLSIGVCAAVSSRMLEENLTHSVNRQLEAEARGNVLVTSSSADAEAARAAFRSLSIRDWTESIQVSGMLRAINGKDAVPRLRELSAGRTFFASNKLNIEGIDPAAGFRAYSLSGGRDLNAADSSRSSALLLEDYRLLGIKTGDRVEVLLGDKPVSFTVVGFFQSGFVKTAGMRVDRTALSLYGAPSRVMFALDGGGRTNAVLEKLNEALPASAMAYSVSGTASASLNAMIRVIGAFFSVVTLFSLITAVLTIGNQMVIHLLRRRREIAILKTVGMSNPQNLRAILLENLLLSLIAGSAGTGAALLLSELALKFMFKLPAALDAGGVVYGIALCVLTTLAAAWIAAVPALRTKPAELLRGME